MSAVPMRHLPTHPFDPDAPVVVRFAALGDVVLLTALLQALQARHGRPVDVLSSGAWTPVLLANEPAVGALRIVRSRRAPYWTMPSQWAAVRWLKAHRGPVFLCDPDPHAERLVRRAVPPERLVRAWDHWPGDDIHWVDWWHQVARLAPAALPGPATATTAPGDEAAPIVPGPRLLLSPAWREATAQWITHKDWQDRPLVLVQPGHKKTHKRGRLMTAQHDKHWPDERWAGVIAGVLHDLPQAVVLVCGSPREHGLAQQVVEAAGDPRVVNAARELPLERLMALAAVAHSMVSVDTGPAHVAAAMDCPLVVLFGRFGWGRWVPRAPHAQVIPLGTRQPTAHGRVLDIGVDEVLRAWRSLAPRPASPWPDASPAVGS